MTTSTNSSAKLIVAFKVSRGGRFFNPSHKTFLGEYNLQQMIASQSDHLFAENRDDKGRFTSLHYIDENGSIVVESAYAKKLTGYIDYDGEYDMYICRYLEDLRDDEIEAIKRSSNYVNPEILEYISEL